MPGATAELADAATLDIEPGSFDGVVAWGLLFLLEPPAQESVIRRAAAALRHGGRLLVTAPWQACEWTDVLTGRRSVSLGRERYRGLLAGAGLVLTNETDDEAGNHYWLATKPGDPGRSDRPGG